MIIILDSDVTEIGKLNPIKWDKYIDEKALLCNEIKIGTAPIFVLLYLTAGIYKNGVRKLLPQIGIVEPRTSTNNVNNITRQLSPGQKQPQDEASIPLWDMSLVMVFSVQCLGDFVTY